MNTLENVKEALGSIISFNSNFGNADNKAETVVVAKEALESLTQYMDGDKGEVSDGYHTFNELYEHRHTLFAYILRNAPTAWKSRLHDDATMFDGWFIAGLKIKELPVTYHIPIRLWDLFTCTELLKAPKWDGHTSDDVIKRFQEGINIIKD